MENEENKVAGSSKESVSYVVPVAIVVASIILAGSWVYGRGSSVSIQNQNVAGNASTTPLVSQDDIAPTSGVTLPVVWGSLGKQLVADGVIDDSKFESLYVSRGQFTDEEKKLLLGNTTENIKITRDNAGYYLNLFWALGLANKNVILEKGEMVSPTYGGAQNFASTGGWTMSVGNPMDHYSKHTYFNVTAGQQALVEKVAQGVYRPCCGNSTLFPDCNHGMAMLGLLELMASQGATEQDMWRAALAVNSYWFPDTYATIATYMKNEGTDWKNINPQEVLGADYSSAQGFASISSKVVRAEPVQDAQGCGVGPGQSAPVPPSAQQSGCSI